MKAVVLQGPHRLEVESAPRPRADEERVLLHVTHGGICGTDLSLYEGAMPTEYPRILGHEIVAEVIEGDDVLKGQRALVDPALCCGNCALCRGGRTNLCLRGGLIGREVDGGFAEYVAVPRSQVYVLPEDIDPPTAPLIQVLTTCRHAQSFVDIDSGTSVAVTGLGVTGQLHLQLAKLRGAKPVMGISRSAWKRNLAERLGADLALPSGDDAAAAILEATAGLGADVVIECTGKTKVMADAVHTARPGGTVVWFGTATETRSELPFFQMYFKELTIVNTRAARGEDFPAAIDMVSKGAVQLGPLVSHTMPMANLDDAMRCVGSDSDRRLKLILENDW